MRRLGILMVALSTAALMTVAACGPEEGAETGETTEEVETTDVDADITLEEEEGDLEEAAEETGEAIEEGAEEVGEAAEETGDEIEEAVTDEDEEPQM